MKSPIRWIFEMNVADRQIFTPHKLDQARPSVIELTTNTPGHTLSKLPPPQDCNNTSTCFVNGPQGRGE